MSFIKKTPAQPVNSTFSLEVVPNPVSKFTADQTLQQDAVIQKMQKASKGLFLPNPAVKVNGAIKCGQLYSAGLKVNQMADAMKQHDLVLRVSVSGEHNACAMATPEDLLENKVISSPSGSFALGIQGNTIRHVDFL